jgi:hypothetical protein
MPAAKSCTEAPLTGCKPAFTFPVKETPATGVLAGHEAGELEAEAAVQLLAGGVVPVDVITVPPQPAAAANETETDKKRRKRGTIIFVFTTGQMVGIGSTQRSTL